MNPAEFANIAAAERRMWWYRGQRAILWRLLDPLAQRGSRALEVGAGTGFMAREMAARYQWRVTPTDLTCAVPQAALADARALPFANGTFDAVVSFDMLVHLEPGDELRAIAEMGRVLRPGGLLVLRAAAFETLRSNHSKFVEERQRYSRPRLRRAVEAAGCTVRRATYANMLLLPVALVKFRLWEPLTGGRPSSGVEVPAAWLNVLLEAPLRIEAALIGAGLNLPVGQSVVVAAKKA